MACKNRFAETHSMDVEKAFDSLPPQLYQQGRLLRNDLIVHFSKSDDLEGILSGEMDYPPRILPIILLDDLGMVPGEQRKSAEVNLRSALLFLFAVIYIHDAIWDDTSFSDASYIHLANVLFLEAESRFAKLFPPDSIFWNYRRDFWKAYAEAAINEWRLTYPTAFAVQQTDILRGAVLYEPYKLFPVAAALLADLPGQIKGLLQIFDHLHIVQRILKDLNSFAVDINKNKLTYPILKTLAEVGQPGGPELNFQGLSLAMALINIEEKISAEIHDNLELCRSRATDLKMKNLLEYLDRLQMRSVDCLSKFSGALKQPSLEERAHTSFWIFSRSSENKTIPQAVQMAEGYLLSDLSFEESWESHRRGLAGSELVTSRFPATLILEALCNTGHDLRKVVDHYFQYQKANQFAYYDHPELPYADSDTLAALLILFRFSKDFQINQEILETPLDWLEQSILDSGRIPVWIYKDSTNTEETGTSVRLLGEKCGAIEARVLVGLIDYDWSRYQEIVQRSAIQLLERFLVRGGSISVNYPRLFCLWKIAQLLASLYSKEVEQDLGGLIARVSRVFSDVIENEFSRYRVTPQDAAFMILTSRQSNQYEGTFSKWATILLKNQSSDGSWYGEPLFFVPNRGELTTWHTSQKLTTAFCYQALKELLI